MEKCIKPLKGVKSPGCAAIAGFIHGLIETKGLYDEYYSKIGEIPGASAPLTNTDGGYNTTKEQAILKFEYTRKRLDAAVKHASHYPSWSALFDDMFYRIKVAFNSISNKTGLTLAQRQAAADVMYKYVFGNVRSTDRDGGDLTIDTGSPWCSSHGGTKFTQKDFWFGATWNSSGTWKDGSVTIKGYFKDKDGNALNSFPQPIDYFVAATKDYGYSRDKEIHHSQSGTNADEYTIVDRDTDLPIVYERFKLTDIIDTSIIDYEDAKDWENLDKMFVAIPAAKGTVIPLAKLKYRKNGNDTNFNQTVTATNAASWFGRTNSGVTWDATAQTATIGDMGGYARNYVNWWSHAYRYILYAIRQLYPLWRACGFDVIHPSRKCYFTDKPAAASIAGWFINWRPVWSEDDKDNVVGVQLTSAGSVNPYSSMAPFIQYNLRTFYGRIKYTATGTYSIDTNTVGWGNIVSHENLHVLERAIIYNFGTAFFEGMAATMQGYATSDQSSRLLDSYVFKYTNTGTTKNPVYTISLPAPAKLSAIKSAVDEHNPYNTFTGYHDCPWRNFQTGYSSYNHGYLFFNYLMNAVVRGWDRQYKKAGKNHGYLQYFDAYAESLVGSGKALTDRTLAYTKSTISDSNFAAVTVSGLSQ